METQTIAGSPCPLCGEVAFSRESALPRETSEYDCLWQDGNDSLHAYLLPCECTSCGTVQMVVTRS
jgi:hypothetical protein